MCAVGGVWSGHGGGVGIGTPGGVQTRPTVTLPASDKSREPDAQRELGCLIRHGALNNSIVHRTHAH